MDFALCMCVHVCVKGFYVLVGHIEEVQPEIKWNTMPYKGALLWEELEVQIKCWLFCWLPC